MGVPGDEVRLKEHRRDVASMNSFCSSIRSDAGGTSRLSIHRSELESGSTERRHLPVVRKFHVTEVIVSRTSIIIEFLRRGYANLLNR